MRVIDHKRPPAAKQKNKHSFHLPVIVAAVVAVIGIGGYLLLNTKKSDAPQQATQSVQVQQAIAETPKKGTLRQLTGEQFSTLYNTFAYPNTAQINEATSITGNEAADKIIRRIAEERGYRMRSAPVTSAFQDVGDKYLLQQRAAQPWLDLKADAKKAKINIGLTAAYRSADEQRDIFMQRLSQVGISPASIAAGVSDSQISQLLATTAIPGYSRHHTGYTIDISCEDMPTTSFSYTNCFEWLSAENYKNAKTHGWIPSYPEGAGKQGPDPESWEYVWVGVDAVTE